MSLGVDKAEIHEASFFPGLKGWLLQEEQGVLTTILGFNILTEVTRVRVNYLEWHLGESPGHIDSKWMFFNGYWVTFLRNGRADTKWDLTTASN